MIRIVAGGVVLAVILCWPLPGAGQNKGNPQVTEASKEEYALMERLPEVVGKLGSFNADSKQFSLLVEYQTGAPRGLNEAASIERLMLSIAQQQKRVLTARTPLQRAQRVAHLQELQAQLGRVTTRLQKELANAPKTLKGPFKEFELAATDAAEVRMAFLPVRYDDKGNLKEFTKAELAKLRGKGNKPGIPATFEDLQLGQIVKVVFARKTSAKKAAPAKTKKKDDEETSEVARPQAAMLVILAESPDATPSTPTSPRKKK